MERVREQRFEQIYQACVDRLMAYCLRHAGPNAAEDAVAETLAVAWRKRHQLPDPALPWLIGMARNTILSQRRSHIRQAQTAERLIGLHRQAAATPEDFVVHRRALLDALESLPEDDREALLLVAWDGLTTQQAADVMQTSAGALRTRIHRARKALRQREAELVTPEAMTHEAMTQEERRS